MIKLIPVLLKCLMLGASIGIANAECTFVVSVDTDVSSNSTVEFNYTAEGPGENNYTPPPITGGRSSVEQKVDCRFIYTISAREYMHPQAVDATEALSNLARLCTYNRNPVVFFEDGNSRDITFPRDFVCPHKFYNVED